ncbi:hypothetical protein ACIA49_24820 [Kribbella sp. NPDC051587]|uniref:hypothetical protein n=1 Tax=Kribbella sp. NPDC051587 TaxID=3364119 RepID=UPI0037A61FFE
MNLTSPPPVEQLDPEYAADLKHQLVRQARNRRNRWTPLRTWVPIVAATAAIAVSTTTVVALSRKSPSPAGTAGIVQLAPDQSAAEPTEIGPATDAEARAAARRCLVPQQNAYGSASHLGKPADAETATILSARWITTGTENKQLLQTFVTRDEHFWFQCLDGEVLRWSPDQGWIGAWAKDPVPGTWTWSDVPGGVRASYSFRTLPSVDRVELRIRGLDGASPWYGVPVTDRAGYVAGTLPGATAQHGKAEIDVRALDKSGRQVWFTTFG